MTAASIQAAAKKFERAVLDDLRSGTNIDEIIQFIIEIGVLPTDPTHQYTDAELEQREAIIDPIAQRMFAALASSGAIARSAILAVTEELRAPHQQLIANVADESLRLLKTSGFQIDFLIGALNPQTPNTEGIQNLEDRFYAAAGETLATNIAQIVAEQIPSLIHAGDVQGSTARNE